MDNIEKLFEEYVNWAKPASPAIDELIADKEVRFRQMEFAGYPETDILHYRIQELENLVYALLRRLYD